MKIKIIILVISIIVGIVYGSECKQDYECGQYPYAACNGKLNLLYGIAYNKNKDKLIVSGKYNSSDSGPFGYPYLFDLTTSPLENGLNSTNSGLVMTNRIQGEVLAGPGFTTFYRVYQYIPINDILYIQYYQAGSVIFAKFNQQTSEISRILNVWGIPFTLGINKQESQTVIGEYGIKLLTKPIPLEKSDFDNMITLYKDQITSGIILEEKDIYIATYDGRFYLGNTDCRDCEKSELKLLFNDTDAQIITGFLKVGKMLYFSYIGGIKGYSLEDTSKMVQLVSNTSISSMTTDGKYIYYIESGNTISSFVNNAKVLSVEIVDPSQGKPSLPKLIYTPIPGNQCQCSVGFTGNKCSDCVNGKILWNEGIPFCTPILSSGYPETCFTQQDCSLNPFVVCNSNASCSCLPGFTEKNGNDCICESGNVIYTNNYPSCTVNATSTEPTAN